ncbi:MAG: DNA-directed RNA polymerase subunit K [Candidatus Woesearchaeota archaeon]|nr:DNA-directed RNA polymerase subunit K [Candidatus Woesearchaeota archaeon]
MAEKFRYTKYEVARMIGARALQIAQGAQFAITLSEKELEEIGFNPIEIAKKEFDAGVIPLDVTRPMPKDRLKTEVKFGAKKSE